MRRAIAIALGLFVAHCSVSSLDDLKSGQKDASAGSGCVAKQDCSGCPSCTKYCLCVAEENPVACLLACGDAGGSDASAGGAGGTAGAGGTPGVGAAAGKGGAGGSTTGSDGGPDWSNCTSQGSTQACFDCCTTANQAGAAQYWEMIDSCFCGIGAPCADQCTELCTSGGQPSGPCNTCIQSATDCVNSHCMTECYDFIPCNNACAVL